MVQNSLRMLHLTEPATGLRITSHERNGLALLGLEVRVERLNLVLHVLGEVAERSELLGCQVIVTGPDGRDHLVRMIDGRVHMVRIGSAIGLDLLGNLSLPVIDIQSLPLCPGIVRCLHDDRAGLQGLPLLGRQVELAGVCLGQDPR